MYQMLKSDRENIYKPRRNKEGNNRRERNKSKANNDVIGYTNGNIVGITIGDIHGYTKM